MESIRPGRKAQFLGCLMLFFCSFFWGSTFVAQSHAATLIGPFTFLCCRSVVGASVLFLVFLFRALFRRIRGLPAGPASGSETKRSGRVPPELAGGILCGIFLTVASFSQQYGLAMGINAGESAFFSAMYVFFVPVFGRLLFRRRIGGNVLLGAVLMIAGLWMLCVMKKGGSTFGPGHLLTIACAILFTFHIYSVDHFHDADPIAMSCVQFVTCAILSFALAMLFEHPTPDAIRPATVSIAYAGVFSSALAYTLQITGQRLTPPALASIFMSMESVFGFFSEWAAASLGIFGTPFEMEPIRLIGCAVAFCGLVAAQIPFPERKKASGA